MSDKQEHLESPATWRDDSRWQPLKDIWQHITRVIKRQDRQDIEPFRIIYTNWRDETSERHVIPKKIHFGSTKYHPRSQWLMDAYDTRKKQSRTFAMSDMAPISAKHGNTSMATRDPADKGIGIGFQMLAEALITVLEGEQKASITVSDKEIYLNHLNAGAGEHRTRVRYNPLFDTFEAIWFGDPKMTSTNIRLEEDSCLSTLVESILIQFHIIEGDSTINADTASNIDEAARMIRDTFSTPG